MTRPLLCQRILHQKSRAGYQTDSTGLCQHRQVSATLTYEPKRCLAETPTSYGTRWQGSRPQPRQGPMSSTPAKRVPASPSKAERAARQPQLNPPPPHQRALTAQSHLAQPPVSRRNIKGEGNQPLGRPRPVRLQSRRRASLVRLASAADSGLTLLVSAGFSPGYGPPRGNSSSLCRQPALSAAPTASFLHREPRGVTHPAEKRRDPQESQPVSGLLWGSSAVTAKRVTLRCPTPGDGTVPLHGVSRETRREPVTSRSATPVARGTGRLD